jgi:membrane-bound lytic murein transglycosylase B
MLEPPRLHPFPVRTLSSIYIAIAVSLSPICAPAVAATKSESVKTSSEAYGEFIEEAANRFDIPDNWVRAVMGMESGGNAKAVSPKGAMGLMQIMPDTWADLRARYYLGADPFDPHDNILAGAAYLREMFDRFGKSGFLAAYNAGPARVQSYLAGLKALPEETLRYVTKLEKDLSELPNADDRSAAVGTLLWENAGLVAAVSTASRSSSAALTGNRLSGAGTTKAFALAPQSAGLFVTLGVASR